MTPRTIDRRSVRRTVLAALVGAALLSPTSGRAAQPTEPTTLRECYKSIRSCQKSRCGKLDGQEQVTCVQQCMREYETCVGGAGSGSNVLGFPQKEATPGKVRKQRHPNMQRNQSQGE